MQSPDAGCAPAQLLVAVPELARLIADEISKPHLIETITFGVLWNLYFEQRVELRHKNSDNACYFYKAHGRRWQDIQVGAIKRRDVQEWHDELAKSSRSSAQRAVNQMAAIINFGIRQDHLPAITNPCIGVEKFKIASRKRFVAPDEFSRLKAALDEEPPLMRDFFWTCLLTGARRGNVLAMKWNQIDFDLETWTIPDGETKNGEALVVPLSPWALDVLKRRRQDRSGSPWVFPGRRPGDHLQEPMRAWRRVLHRAQIGDLRIHDLRRTLASYMAMSGENQFVIAAALGHKDMRSTAVYARLNLAPVRRASEGVSDKWRDLVALPAPTMVPLLETEKPKVTRQPNSNPKNAGVKLTTSEQIIIEARILTAINKGATTKKAFYKTIGSRIALNSLELDRVLSSMVERGILERVQDDGGTWRYLLATEQAD